MAVEFEATEAGFEDGLGGASNAASQEEPHYVLFGLQVDEEHPDVTGVYFEFDDEENGGVDTVVRVTVDGESARFELAVGEAVVVRRGMEEPAWRQFTDGARRVFGSRVVEA